LGLLVLLDDRAAQISYDGQTFIGGTMNKAWLLLALAGCWTSKKESENPPPNADVTVELAAVTLAEDCGEGGTLPPPTRVAAREPASPPPAQEPASAVPSRVAPGYVAHCEPTSMQLAVRSSVTEPMKLSIKKVELLDKTGKVLGVLTARTPSKWSGNGYEAWDQQIAPGASLATSYRLSAPLWHEFLPGGRYEAHTKTYQLRVTVDVGSGERTVEKKAISVAMMEPPVPT